MSTRFLSRQLEEQVEAWKADHAEAQQCFDFEDKIAHCLWVFDRIEQRCKSIHPRTVDSEEMVVQLTRLWLTLAAFLLDRAEDHPFPQYNVNGLDDLRSKFERVVTNASDLERIARTLENVRNGKTLTLQQAINGLRSRCHG